MKKRLIKVHGSLSTNDIIFGVEDKAQIRERDIFLKKSFNKSFKALNLKKQLDNISELFIFGHSLGETDHMYFTSFFQTYSHESYYDRGKKIHLYHYGENAYKDLHIQLDNMTLKNLTGLKQNNELNYIDTSPLPCEQCH